MPRVEDLFINEESPEKLVKYKPRYGPKQGFKNIEETKNPKMINFSINIPQIYLTWIGRGIKVGMYCSRSEAIRIATRQFLIREIKFIKELFTK